MNSLMRGYYPTFELYQALREQLMEILEDDDLTYKPGGENVSLGALCREIGETETSYIRSFQTFTLDFSYRNEEPGLDSRVDRLTVWYRKLDQELKTTLESFSEDDLANRIIDRGSGFELPPLSQLDVYKEALLIFYGKVSVYLKALGKPRPEQWQEWIA